MTSTPKSLKSDSLNGSWVDLDESPYQNFIKKSSHGSENSSFEKIMMDVQNELIALSSNGSCKEQFQQINQKLVSKTSDQLQLDAQQFKLNQLETFENERFQNLNSELYWYWDDSTDSDCKDFFNDDRKMNLRQWAVRRNIFSKEVLSLLIFSNVVSVVLGVGIGYTALIRRFL